MREANIPLFLWVATAVVAHGFWGGGADKAAKLIGETMEIRDFAASVRRHAKGVGKPIEIAFLETEEAEEDRPDPLAEEEKDPETEPAPDDESALKDEPDSKLKKPAPESETEEPKPEEKKEDEKKPEEKKEDEKPKNELVIQKLPDPERQRRIAVKQHVDDPNQADNPDAEFIADQANKVREQTQANITATDQDDAKPAPGSSLAQGPADTPGSGHVDKVAQSEERDGDPDRAPQEKQEASQASDPQKPQAQSPEQVASLQGAQRQQDGHAQGSQYSHKESTLPGQAGQRAQQASREQEESPDTLSSESGAFTVPGPRQASVEQQARRAKKKRELPKLRSQGSSDLLGLGANGLSPGGVNLNLNPTLASNVIGRDKLNREKRADGQRRLSEHRGSWKTGGIERWRHAIENYVPSVKPGNQTALNSARVPFASYLNMVHNRLHPVFADTFLMGLDGLPRSHPMNQPDLVTHLEIVLDQAEGRIQRMGVAKTSGVTAFDISALESVDKAQPFGPPPREIVSPDGNVYFHWEFYRNPQYACSTYFAHPFILKTAPKTAPPPSTPEKPPVEEYQPPDPGQRHGQAEPQETSPGPG